MEEEKYLTGIVDGNTVRTAQPLTKPKTNVEPKRKSNLDPFKINKISKKNWFLMGLAFVACVTLVIVNIYIGSQFKNTQRNIAALKTKISTVQSENDAIKFSINSNIDTNKIYKLATKKLGMVQAKEKQIINYKSSDSGYTVQFKDIPQE